MGLITKQVDVYFKGGNAKYYEKLGYIIPKYTNKNGKEKTDINKSIKVNVEDLPNGSHQKISYICDGLNCNKQVDNIEWRDYLRRKHPENGFTYCHDCSCRIFARDIIRQKCLSKSISFSEWCIKNNKQFVLEYLWDYENNKDLPENITFSSNVNVFFFCENNIHDIYKKQLANAIHCDFHCPECVRERDESYLQEKVRLYLENSFIVKHERYTSIFCINKKTGARLLYDNEVITNNFKLIVEVHGQQHYQTNFFHAFAAKMHNSTLKQELKLLQERDKLKKDYALSQGYYYLEIPYTANDKTETYKTMIDNTLKFIYKEKSINE